MKRIESASQSEQPLVTKCVGGEPHQSCLGLSQEIQDFRWPQLKHFGLEGFMMHTDAELISFFDRHQGTIECSLSFRRGTFANGENYRAEVRSEADDKASGHIMCYCCILLSNKMFIYP